MKGMLIKDFRILKHQGKILFLMLLVAAVFMNLISSCLYYDHFFAVYSHHG